MESNRIAVERPHAESWNISLSVICNEMRKSGSSIDAVAYVVKRILDDTDHNLVKKCYDYCSKGVM